MVIETKANQQAVSGEASTSSRKRQRRLPSIVEDEAVPAPEGGVGANGGGTASGNQIRAGDEVITTAVRSGTLLDLDLLECPICCHALTIPIFQCDDNGHIACSSCCSKISNKCPVCKSPIGKYRCRVSERVLEAITVPCPNAQHGCAEKFSYGAELVHEKECAYALCYCPAPNCNYRGVYKDLYSHYYANHSHTRNCFSSGILVIDQGCDDGALVVVQSFKEPHGVYVTVNCIAPCAPEVNKFSYKLVYSLGGNTMMFGSREMNRIQKVSFKTPEKDFLLVPYYLQGDKEILEMLEICIHWLEEDEDEEEDQEWISPVNLCKCK
ncbi:unnamed protein product [Thlaspi arvense]|uniref:RING-type E3 ubiquitin transferase n=1 Tax=Thlaspi arvense TaxID=13288 RepID=A0AAU9RQK6_THLAR|nr:unnamed protein product [Thlaspi arvense]